MKLTKGRIQKLFAKQNQTRKSYKNKKNIPRSNHYIMSKKNKKRLLNLQCQTMKNL
jgi:hypothetical protein